MQIVFLVVLQFGLCDSSRVEEWQLYEDDSGNKEEEGLGRDPKYYSDPFSKNVQRRNMVISIH